jgi:hypothetical protein
MASVLCVSFLAFAFWSSTALAAFQHPFLSQLTGAPRGGEGSLCGVTVDPASQNIYVGIPSTAIDVFNASGIYQSLITGMGTPNGSFSSACTTAVNDVNGDVYVADSGSDVVFVFGALGNYLSTMNGSAPPASSVTPGGSFGKGAGAVHVAVDQSSGDVYVSDSSHGVVDRFSSAGVYLSQLTGFSSPSGVASDASGDVYVADQGLGVVDEFNSAGTQVGQITGSGVPGGSFGSLTGVAVDAAGHVYVADRGRRVVDEFDALGAFVGQVTGTPSAFFNEPEGVAVNAAGDLYVADNSYWNSPGVVDVFGPSASGPFIAGEPASSVTSTSVTLRAQVNPNGQDTTYYFQYGASSSYAVSVPVAPGADIGSGSGYQAVSQVIGGLAPGTSYHYRVVAVNSALETSYGPDQLFGTNVTPGAPPSYSSSPGLPDGRVYEQVSPTDKNGNAAGAGAGGGSGQREEEYSVASADGDAVLFWASGAVGNASSGLADYFVARRSAAGWSTTSALPRPTSGEISVFSSPSVMLASADLSHVAFQQASENGTGFGFPGIGKGYQLYLAGSDPLAQPAWLSQPTIPAPIQNGQAPWLAGASPDLSTVYFGEDGTLLPQDASRTPYAGKQSNSYINPSAAGLYEWKNGVLMPAGVLPDGSVDPFGAVPAAEALAYNTSPTLVVAEDLNNQVSTDGSRAFFVSPDPSFCAQNSPVCGGDQPELYARVTAADGSQSTVLVSKSAVTGRPAPHGPLQIRNPRVSTIDPGDGTVQPYVYASPDGSRAFFESMDQLTSDAPNGSSVKAYDFDLTTGSLAYLPGVADLPPESASADVGGPLGPSSILVSSLDGSDLIFVRYPAGGVPQLELWRSGPSGGTVIPISQLPPSPAHEKEYSESREPRPGGMAFVAARATADGSVFMFETDSSLPGFNNAPGYDEIYRYDAAANTLSCVSCPPAGITPSGNASFSENNVLRPPLNGQLSGWLNAGRGMSADGSRIFFDTPDPLVPQDTNTRPTEEQNSGATTRRYGADVYEWENGKIYLLSSGTGVKDSLLLDSSASGNDVFFATTDGLVAGDTDGGYDVYDARVPRPGDVPLPSAVPCQGDVCQGPPRVPSLLGASPSETFSGPGNPAPLPAAKAVTHKQVKKKSKKAKKHKQKRKKASTRSKGRRK